MTRPLGPPATHPWRPTDRANRSFTGARAPSCGACARTGDRFVQATTGEGLSTPKPLRHTSHRTIDLDPPARLPSSNRTACLQVAREGTHDRRLHLRRHPHPARARQGQRLAARGQARSAWSPACCTSCRPATPDLDPNVIDDVILGCVTPVGDQGADIAKTAAHRGRPARHGRRHPDQPLLRLGARSGQHGRARRSRSGWDQLIIAGGVESMSRVPMGSDGGAVGDGPRDRLRHLLRAAGHQRGPDRHHRGLHPRRRRRLRGASRSERPPTAWSAGRLRQVRRPGHDHNGVVDPRPRRAHAARHHDGRPGQAQALLRRDRRDGRLRRRRAAEVPLGRADRPRPHPRQLLRHRRRRRAGADRQRAGRQGLRHGPARPRSWPPRSPAQTRRSCSPAPPRPPTRCSPPRG